ncbi:hypothetical protein M378DRAFT_12346 [Amanita muscaria Koide BX008]|uniref:Ribophorin II C-terminal domain-containing protein n=1 Tax=Amanita muscaria (strain Koide BX008) TaxID=946122 RepID=A0A0C2X1V2_AMAMK|nr:hypothetical protein M378DRAFT_12346 [Amanita muscaria Koide BX008]
MAWLSPTWPFRSYFSQLSPKQQSRSTPSNHRKLSPPRVQAHLCSLNRYGETATLPPTTGAPLLVTLLIGTPDYSPLSTDLFEVSITASTRPPRGSLLPSPPEIQHTFRPEQKHPPRPISAFFALAALAPWAVLLSLWSAYAPRPKHLFSPRIFPFVGTLAALEGLLFWY